MPDLPISYRHTVTFFNTADMLRPIYDNTYHWLIVVPTFQTLIMKLSQYIIELVVYYYLHDPY